MDLGSIIIGSILLAISIVPLVIMHYNRVKKEKSRLQSLNEIAIQHNCNISQHEFCSDFAIGLDENRKFVFFLKQKKDEVFTQFVDLSDIQNCKVLKKSVNSKSNSESYNITEYIELAFIPKNKNKTEPKFELYNVEINTQLSGELQFVDKWTKLINSRLN